MPPLLTQEQVDHAIASLDGLVTDAMDRTGVPGVAVAVVHQDRVVYSKGFGVREVGKRETVDPDTVFQLASVSKPLASTVVAGIVGQGVVEWDDPVRASDPSFALNDSYVTEHATFADLLSHRSGLHTGAGDLLKDRGFDRDYILSHLAGRFARSEPSNPSPPKTARRRVSSGGAAERPCSRRGHPMSQYTRPSLVKLNISSTNS